MSDTEDLFATVAPDWHAFPHAVPEVDLPSEWQGMPVDWQEGYSSRPVFVGQARLPNSAEAYLFGARFDTAKAVLKGRALPPGHFVEYFVAELGKGSPAMHRLYQKRGVVYSSNPGKGDHISADDLDAEMITSLCCSKPPAWKIEDAEWPTCEGRPMIFVSDFILPENDITQQFLTWDKRVFLFWEGAAKCSCFKVTTQDVDYQSAEDHYATE